MFTFGFAIPSTAEGLLILAIALVVLWIVVSVPVFIAGELMTDGRADFGMAMAATLGGAVMYVLVFAILYSLETLPAARTVFSHHRLAGYSSTQ